MQILQPTVLLLEYVNVEYVNVCFTSLFSLYLYMLKSHILFFQKKLLQSEHIIRRRKRAPNLKYMLTKAPFTKRTNANHNAFSSIDFGLNLTRVFIAVDATVTFQINQIYNAL